MSKIVAATTLEGQKKAGKEEQYFLYLFHWRKKLVNFYYTLLLAPERCLPAEQITMKTFLYDVHVTGLDL